MTILQGVNLPPLSGSVTLDSILSEVAEETGLAQYMIRMDSRKKAHVYGRYLFCKRADKHFNRSEIGRYLDRHHTSIKNLIENYEP